jgi:HEPN domain-containing protein
MDSNRTNLALGYLRTAYNDYIAARVLLNRGYTLQGAMLSSTAIEKYFKAGICLATGEILKVHMDRFEVIKNQVIEMGYGILIEKIDSIFFDLLSKAYIVRYYDNITEPFTIGFFRNQFLGELDGAVELFELLFVLSKKRSDEKVLSPLKMDYRTGNPDLFENNWVTTKEKDKKKFMETDCKGFAVHILPGNLFEEIHVTSQNLHVPYEGTMTLIKINN